MALVNTESHQTYSLSSHALTPGPRGERGTAGGCHDDAAEHHADTASAGGAAVAGLHAALRLVPDLVPVSACGSVITVISAAIVTATTPKITRALRLLLDELNTTPPHIPGDPRPITYTISTQPD